MDKLRPDPRARLRNRIPEDSAGCCRSLRETPQGPTFSLRKQGRKKTILTQYLQSPSHPGMIHILLPSRMCTLFRITKAQGGVAMPGTGSDR